MEARIDPEIRLKIEHLTDEEDKLLQAADIFSWGIFRKYERGDTEWYQYFCNKIGFDTLYLE